jgi:hypothetical protein
MIEVCISAINSLSTDVADPKISCPNVVIVQPFDLGSTLLSRAPAILLRHTSALANSSALRATESVVSNRYSAVQTNTLTRRRVSRTNATHAFNAPPRGFVLISPTLTRVVKKKSVPRAVFGVVVALILKIFLPVSHAALL